MRFIYIFLLFGGLSSATAGIMLAEKGPRTSAVDLSSYDPSRGKINDKEEICKELQSLNKYKIINKIYEEKNKYKRIRNNYLYVQSQQILGHPDGEKLDEWGRQYEELLKNQEELIQDISLCAFSKQLKDSIQENVGNLANTNFLEKLDNISTCFKHSEGVSSSLIKDSSRSIFDSIFNFFSKKKELTKEDCSVLERTYEAWASFQDSENDMAMGSNLEDEISLYNVNPHNSSFIHWLKEREKGNIPPGGLPLLHVDTHTDLGHIHSHGDGWSRDVGINGLAELVTTEGNEFKEKLRKILLENGADQSSVEALATKDTAELKEEVFEQMRARVHEISQPLVAGLATDVSSSLIMALPPWSTRLPRTEYDDETGSNPFKVRLYEDDRAEEIGLSTEDPKILRTSYRPIVGPTLDEKLIKEFDMVVVDANLETRLVTNDKDGSEISTMIDVREETPADSFVNHFPKGKDKFILDIDLDAFVSEGRGIVEAEPVSFGRHEKRYGTHNGHDPNTETDPNVEVPTKEFELIEGRVDHFFKNLEKLKEDGKLPAVITIADSTILQAAMTKNMDDGQVGGNFTPTCLVFLLNYMVKERLRKMYNIKTQP